MKTIIFPIALITSFLPTIRGFHNLIHPQHRTQHQHRHHTPLSIRSNRQVRNPKSPFLTCYYNKKTPKRYMSIQSEDNDDETNSSLTISSSPLDKPILATIDFISLITFAAVGKANHSPDGSLDIIAVLTTAFPFLMAWYVTSPFTGIYNQTIMDFNKSDDDESKRVNNDIGIIAFDAGKVAAKGWVVAIPLGCVFRGLIKGYVPPAPFVIVTLIATLVILGGFRILYAIVIDKIKE